MAGSIKASRIDLNDSGNTFLSISGSNDEMMIYARNQYVGSFYYTPGSSEPGFYTTGKIWLDGGSLNRNIVHTATNGYGAYYVLQTAYSTRWSIGKSAETESTGNVGSNFIVSRYSDTGTYIEDALKINRATGEVSDNKGPLRDVPINTPAGGAYTLTIDDVGECVSSTANITIPNAVFSTGEVITIYNNGTASRNIVNAGAVTMRLAGTNNQNTRIMSQYALATIFCVSANTFIVSGSGVL